MLAVAAVVFVVVLDQVAKALVRASLKPASPIVLVKRLLYLTHVRNTGAAFGLMPGQQSLFILTSVLVLAGIGLYWWRARPRSLVLALSLGLVAGGALGNLIDRIAFGRVTDFVDIRILPVFNFADMAIVTGAIGLFAWAMFAPLEPHEAEGEGAGDGAETREGHPDVTIEQRIEQPIEQRDAAE